jgi:hypothetical protein
MVAQMLEKDWWWLLWVPPSPSYYRSTGPFAGVDGTAVTKLMVFSSWHVVPRALSALPSYDAEG